MVITTIVKIILLSFEPQFHKNDFISFDIRFFYVNLFRFLYGVLWRFVL